MDPVCRAQIDAYVTSFDPIQPETALRSQFETSFAQRSFLDEEVDHFVACAKTHITTRQAAELFSRVISYKLAKQMFRQNTQDASSELIRVSAAMRYCTDKKLDARESFDCLEQTDIKSEDLRYRFAAFVCKRDPAEFTNEVGVLNLRNPVLNRRLAELALYVDPKAFFENLNEFNFFDGAEREEFLLRGLMRSTEAADQLIDDVWFTERLEKLPPIVFAELYERFHFGKKEIQASGLAASRGLTEAQVFSKLLTDSEFTFFIKESELANPKLFLCLLDDKEKLPLLAMILLLGGMDNPVEVTKRQDIQALFDEINKFPHPSVRYAIVAILLAMAKQGHDVSSQLTHCLEAKSGYPRFLSLLLHACDRLSPEASFKDALVQKWKSQDFRTNFTLFLAELVKGEKLDAPLKASILQKCLTDKTHQTDDALIQYASCLRRRLIKPLRLNTHPSTVLAQRLQLALARLGEPYGCSLSSEQLANLQYLEEIGHYAQSLQQLSDQDKQRMVPFFFRFLRLSAEGRMQEERYQTRELQDLFAAFKLDINIWKRERQSTVAEILARSPSVQMMTAQPLYIQSELKTAFEHGHLLQKDYPELYAHIFEGGQAPILDGREFGRLTKENTLDSIRKRQSDRLANLYACTDNKKQINFLMQLIKLFPGASDFGIDLANWKKALNDFFSQNRAGYGNYKIRVSGDPYLLFRIGSIAGTSCQRVTGDPAKNITLLAYPGDGKNKALTAETPDGTVTGRAILRFFYAGEKINPSEWRAASLGIIPMAKQTGFRLSHPVLYLEPFYPSGVPEELRTAMTLSAMEVARELGVPLVRLYKKEEKQAGDADYPFTLRTINSPAPYEYFDGTDQKIKPCDTTDGYFMAWINGAKVKVLYELIV